MMESPVSQTWIEMLTSLGLSQVTSGKFHLRLEPQFPHFKHSNVGVEVLVLWLACN